MLRLKFIIISLALYCFHYFKIIYIELNKQKMELKKRSEFNANAREKEPN